MRRAGAPLLAIGIVLVLPSCGGDDADQQTSAGAAGEGQSATASPKAEKPSNGNGRPERAASQGATAADAGPEPGTKAVAPGVPVQRGGDNSVQTFGAEAEVDQREQALATLSAYLNARVARQWEKACAATSEEFKEQLATLVDIGKGKEKPEGCAETLRLFFRSFPRSVLRQSAQIKELLSFRVKDDYAYVIFRGAGGEVKFIAMADDDGEWKVNTTEPAAFAPNS